MHLTRFVMKDGRRFSAVVWDFKPAEGYLTIVAEDGREDPRIALRDIESAVTENERLSINTIGDDDLLARARRHGWNGQ